MVDFCIDDERITPGTASDTGAVPAPDGGVSPDVTETRREVREAQNAYEEVRFSATLEVVGAARQRLREAQKAHRLALKRKKEMF